jgi:hypothetical protein
VIGFLFILFIFLYLLFGFFLYGYIRGWGPSKRKALLITLVLMLGLPFGDVIPGKLYLAYLCQQSGGITINEVVQTPGYLALDDYSYGCGQGCIQRLLEWRKNGTPMFIEAFVDNPKEYNFVDAPGYYRFELVKRTAKKCTRYDSILKKYPIRFSNIDVPEQYCLTAEAIISPSAKFAVQSWIRNNRISRTLGISADHAYIFRISNGERLASATQFIHVGGWLRRSIADVVAFSHPDNCPSGMTYPLGYELMRRTFN